MLFSRFITGAIILVVVLMCIMPIAQGGGLEGISVTVGAQPKNLISKAKGKGSAGGMPKKEERSNAYMKKKTEEKEKEEDRAVRAARHGGGKQAAAIDFSVLNVVQAEEERQKKAKNKNIHSPLKQEKGKQPAQTVAPEQPQGGYKVGDFALQDEDGDWCAQVFQASGAVSWIKLGVFLASFRSVPEKDMESTPHHKKGVALKEWVKESVVKRFREDRKAAKKARQKDEKAGGGSEGAVQVAS